MNRLGIAFHQNVSVLLVSEVQLFLLSRQCSTCFVALVNFQSFEEFNFSCFASISISVGSEITEVCTVILEVTLVSLFP